MSGEMTQIEYPPLVFLRLNWINHQTMAHGLWRYALG
jgi:hypothetical protein